MSFVLLPGTVAESLTELTPEFLKSKGIRLLMLDFDNTIVPYTTSCPTEEVERWLREMTRQQALQLCVVSNSRKSRVQVFCKEYGLDCITHAKKPFSKGIRECMKRYGIPPENCALVGDQIYTDVLGANCAGVQSVLVRAIHNHTIWLKLRHIAELPFRAAAENRRIQK